MTGPKLNEASFVAGERTGTKATARYIHSSAYKAREVLNIIRGLPVRRADEVLQFTDRSVSVTIRKVLASAVANAQHNDELDPETLFVKACFADEGPTLKRFTPRARGRAGRIRKRTSHITIVLGVLDDDRLEIVQAREARRTAAGRRRRGAAATPTSSRAARVERSRQRAAQLRDGETAEELGAVDETEELAGAVQEMEDGSIIVPADEDTEITTTTTTDDAATTTVDELSGGATEDEQSGRADRAADGEEDQ
jgi:large subunit ribosomal protein L22